MLYVAIIAVCHYLFDIDISILATANENNVTIITITTSIILAFSVIMSWLLRLRPLLL